MATSGPITRDTSTLQLGLAQIRVGASATNIGQINPVFTANDSIGSLADTKFTGNTTYFEHKSGFPQKTDYSIAISEEAALECSFEEIKPFSIAMANGLDPSSGYTMNHSGEVPLGGKVSPSYVRMEAMYTFPNGTNYMHIIFPRAQVKSSLELSFEKESNSKVPVTFSSTLASSDVSGGSSVWDNKPLGRIMFT